MLLTSLIAAATLAGASAPIQAPLPAGSDAAAVLVQPRDVRQILDGRNWSCNGGGECVGRGGGTTQPLMRECRRFVARFGPVSSFSRQGLALTEAEIGQCNADNLVRSPRSPSA